ncbi:probable protein phosphatase 2C 73 [Camellia sinensis]|uniref:probable protein phosphatase 2C 73 n=1 Tax=Camellia sinensis TaxID=4442 RepID=UPI001036E5AA|nr:probable protein phosphatase 2C 73 [Camellia sinensis]
MQLAASPLQLPLEVPFEGTTARRPLLCHLQAATVKVGPDALVVILPTSQAVNMTDNCQLQREESAIFHEDNPERLVEMGHFSSLFNGLAQSFSIKNGRNSGYCGERESAESMVKESKKNELILRSSGTVHVNGSNNFASVFSKRGEKGVNQDCFIVGEVDF